MNNMNLMQLYKTAAMRRPDTGVSGAAAATGDEAMQGSAANAAAQNIAEEIWRREEELKRREAEITRRELLAKAMETLTAMDMPAELAQLLDYTDEAHCKASLETLKTSGRLRSRRLWRPGWRALRPRRATASVQRKTAPCAQRFPRTTIVEKRRNEKWQLPLPMCEPMCRMRSARM